MKRRELLRHSLMSCRLAAVQNTAQVALEAGNPDASGQIIFRHYRERVRPMDAEKWVAITPASAEAARAAGEGDEEGKKVKLPKAAPA